MLLSWAWLLLEGLLTRSAALAGHRGATAAALPDPADPPESLFFALPFFFVTTAWNSGRALFTGLLGAAAARHHRPAVLQVAGRAAGCT